MSYDVKSTRPRPPVARKRSSRNGASFSAYSPGAALSCVVLARLPFPQVGEPIVEARGEKVAEEGGSAFRDYLLPEAIIRFRQGFGRLVRTKSDRGVVVVTDSRIVTKNYGALFRKAIPASVHAVTSLDELISRTSAFFSL